MKRIGPKKLIVGFALTLFIVFITVIKFANKEAKAAMPWQVFSASQVTTGSAVSVSFAAGKGYDNAKCYYFSCPSNGIYEAYTYNNTNNCDPIIMAYDYNDNMYLGTDDDTGIGFNAYVHYTMTKGHKYYFVVYENAGVSTDCKFVIKNSTNSAESLSVGQTKTVSVDTTSATKWFKFAPPKTYTRYRLMTSSGTIQMEYNMDNLGCTCDLSDSEPYKTYIGYFDVSGTQYFCVQGISGSSVTIGANTDTTNTLSVKDNNTALTNKEVLAPDSKYKFYRIKGNATIGNTVNLSVESNTNYTSYVWTYRDDSDKLIILQEGSSSTYSYNVSGTKTITCYVYDKYFNQGKIVYIITGTGAVTKYKVTLDVKKGKETISTSGITSGDSYSGTQALTVTCKNACRVYATTDNNVYTRYSCSNTGTNTYRYNFTVNKALTLVVAMLGDVNMDGTVDSADALLILRYDVNKATFNSLQKLIADVNGDSKIDSADALLILRLDVNKATFSW